MKQSVAVIISLVFSLPCFAERGESADHFANAGRASATRQIVLPISIPGHVKRILFLGNSITWAGGYVNDIDAYLIAKSPQKTYYIINAGLPSETVSGLSEAGHADGSFPRPDLHERLARVLDATKPDLVFACYGMNDGIYLPFDSTRFAAFRDGINWLHDAVQKSGAAIIHITPPVYDEGIGKATGYANVLDQYSNWLLSMKRSGWKVADIHFPMKKYLVRKRREDPAFSLAADGVHPGETGHWIIAKQLLMYLGFKHLRKANTVNRSLNTIVNGDEYLKLITECNNMVRDAWLSETKHLRPGLPAGLPMRDAEIKYVEFRGKIMELVTNKTTGFSQ